MKTISKVLETSPLVSPYRGSEKTLALVIEELKQRPEFGPKVAKNFNPYKDAMPYGSWLRQGYKVRKGSKAIRSVTFVDSADKDTGEIKKIRKTVALFHRTQVDPIIN